MGYNFDVTAATAITKYKYTSRYIEDQIMKSPAFALMPKDPNQGGTNFNGAMNYAPPTTISMVDTIAFGGSNGNASKYSNWIIPWTDGPYGSANVTGGALDRTMSEEDAMVKVVTREVDLLLKSMATVVSSALWSYGGGAIGQISASSNVGTTIITLADPASIVKFFAGMVLQSSSDNGTGGAGARSGTVTVASVDINNNTVTATGNWTAGIASAAALDYLFWNGGYNTSIAGIPAWIPDANNRPISSDSFYGVNRFTTDPTRMAGTFKKGNGAPKEETFIDLLTQMAMLGATPTHAMVSTSDYADLIKGLGSRVVQAMTSERAWGTSQISFSGAKIAAPTGFLTVMMDPFVPKGSGWALDPKDFLLASLKGEYPHIEEGVDGLMWQRSPTADSYQLRVIGRGALYCSDPSRQGVVTF